MPEKDQKSKIVEKEKKSVFNTIGRYGRDAGWLLLNKKKKKERLEYAKNLIKHLPKTHKRISYVAIGDKIGYPGVPYPKIVKMIDQLIKTSELNAYIENDMVIFQKETENDSIQEIRNDIKELKKHRDELDKTTAAIKADLQVLKKRMDEKISTIPKIIKQMIDKASDMQLRKKFQQLQAHLDQEKKRPVRKRHFRK